MSTTDAVSKKKTLTLSDYTDEMLALDDLAAMDEGEWTDAHQTLADELGAKLAQKTDDVWHYRETLRSDAERARTVAKDISDKAKRLTARVEWLDNYIKAEMRRSGRSTLQGAIWKIREQRNSQPSVTVDVLPAALPAAFVRTIPAVIEPDKPAIAKAILAGDVIAGCSVDFGTHLRAS